MSAFDAVIAERQRSFWLYPSRLIIVLMIALGVWAWLTPLDEVAVAEGTVAPQGKVKVIQHLEGGIIQELMVAEGDTVRAGDALLRLELDAERSNPQELLARLDGLMLARATWAAEIDGKSPKIDEGAASRRPADASRAIQTYEARQAEIKSAIDVANKRIRQRGLAIETLETRRRAVQNDLALAQENLAIASQAANSGLATRTEELELRREVEQLLGEIDTLAAEIRQARADREEAAARLTEVRSRYTAEATERLGEIDRDIASIRETLSSAQEQTLRTTIRTPIEGVVKKMRYHTIGGVVRPGEAIMEIVPARDDLVIEARLNPRDRGYVSIGQNATVKITTYDFTRYGTLTGQLMLIGADTEDDEDGVPYFRLVVQSDKPYLGTADNPLRISPGMEAEVNIHTGTRTVLEYFLRPLLRLRHDAFRER